MRKKQDCKKKQWAVTERRKPRISSDLDVITPCTCYWKSRPLYSYSIIRVIHQSNAITPCSESMNSHLYLQQDLKTEGKIILCLIKQERNTVKWYFPVASLWKSRGRAEPFPYLCVLLFCTVQPSVLDFLLLFGHFHDLLKRSIIFTRVFC